MNIINREFDLGIRRAPTSLRIVINDVTYITLYNEVIGCGRLSQLRSDDP